MGLFSKSTVAKIIAPMQKIMKELEEFESTSAIEAHGMREDARALLNTADQISKESEKARQVRKNFEALLAGKIAVETEDSSVAKIAAE